MTYRESSRKARSNIARRIAVGLIVVGPAIAGLVIYQTANQLPALFSEDRAPAVQRAAPESATSSAPSFSRTGGGDEHGRPTRGDGALTEGDGVLPGGVSAVGDKNPGVTKLAPELLDALRQAATEAADDGVMLYITSGWRSPEYQEHLLNGAVSEYGSEEEAARWVATADTSAHVSGDAVDIGSSDAIMWLSNHGADYGLCQIYHNEPWHFELRPEAIDGGCPPMFADPTHDPRMQQ